MSIGSRSQGGRTYLETNCESFLDLPIDQLMIKGLSAMQQCLQNSNEISADFIEIAHVDASRKFCILTKAQTEAIIIQKQGVATNNQV